MITKLLPYFLSISFQFQLHWYIPTGEVSLFSLKFRKTKIMFFGSNLAYSHNAYVFNKTNIYCNASDRNFANLS